MKLLKMLHKCYLFFLICLLLVCLPSFKFNQNKALACNFSDKTISVTHTVKFSSCFNTQSGATLLSVSHSVPLCQPAGQLHCGYSLAPLLHSCLFLTIFPKMDSQSTLSKFLGLLGATSSHTASLVICNMHLSFTSHSHILPYISY